jgi:hypothetical protein
MKIQIATHDVDLPDLHESASNSIPVASFWAAADAANSFYSENARIRDDAFLSDAGRAAKVAPLADKLLKQILVSTENIINDSVHWNGREAALLDVGAPSSQNEIDRDREIRSWWRSAPAEVREHVMHEVEASPEHGELVRAILRSPVPDIADLEKKHFRSMHNQIRRLDNPSEAIAIETGKRAHEWAQRGMGHITGIFKNITGRSAADICRAAISAGHEKAATHIFGATAVAHAKAAIAAEQRRLA